MPFFFLRQDISRSSFLTAIFLIEITLVQKALKITNYGTNLVVTAIKKSYLVNVSPRIDGSLSKVRPKPQNLQNITFEKIRYNFFVLRVLVDVIQLTYACCLLEPMDRNMKTTNP